VESQGSTRTVTGVLRRRRIWIIATIGLCLAVADLVALLMPPTYEATALLVIDQRSTSPSSDLNATITTGQLLAAHYIKMATTRTVLDAVCADAGDPCSADALKSNLTASTVKGTDLLGISVRDASSNRAADLANLLATKLQDEQRREVANALKPTKAYLDDELATVTKALNASKTPSSTLQAQFATLFARREAVSEQESRLVGSLSKVESASVPSRPAYSRTKTFLLIGLAVGVVVAILVALIVDRVDSRLYATENLADATSAPLVLAC
jgi:capsular polysaccharide biosynthesis protein